MSVDNDRYHRLTTLQQLISKNGAFDSSPYAEVITMGNGMGFTTEEILEAAIITNTKDITKGHLITDYLFLTEHDKQIRYSAKVRELDVNQKIVKDLPQLNGLSLISKNKKWNQSIKDVIFGYIKQSGCLYIIPNSIKWLILNYANSRSFKYVYSGDQNGLLYFLGFQTIVKQKIYVNPSKSKIVTVSTSSLTLDSCDVSSVVGRTAVRLVTRPRPNSWIKIDLKEIKIRLTHYTLRHYSSFDSEALRYWNIEGSNDGIKWFIIKKHIDDRSLNRKGDTKSWQIDTDQYYSIFRILQTGLNSNNHHYLACSGIELYGDASFSTVLQQGLYYNKLSKTPLPKKLEKKKENQEPMQVYKDIIRGYIKKYMLKELNLFSMDIQLLILYFWTSISFDYDYDFDKNGFIYFLGTSCNTKKWKNPAKSDIISVKTSSLSHYSVPCYNIVGRTATKCITNSVPHSWFIIDFKDYYISPTHYTLRHYNSHKSEALRNWKLEASNDGVQWIILQIHANDTSLNEKGKSCTWKLDDISQYYAMFRVEMTGFNSNKHYYLACSGFEIYGYVVRKHQTLTFNDSNIATKTNKGDSWETTITDNPLDNFSEFSILVQNSTKTTNTYKFIVGVVPERFTSSWVGSNGSWGYIAGTGGIIHNTNTSVSFGKAWGKVGDVVTVIANRNQNTIQYLLNNKNQGIPFNDYYNIDSNTKTFGAVSMTETGSVLTLCERVTPFSKPICCKKKKKIKKININMNNIKAKIQNFHSQNIVVLYVKQIQRRLTLNTHIIPNGIEQMIFNFCSSKTFVFVKDFDKNGLLYFSGMKGGSINEYINPAVNCLVNVSSSSLMHDSNPISSFVGRNTVRCVTTAVNQAWMKVDLMNIKIKLTHYSLKHYSSWNTETLRNWNIEASNDVTQWIVLKQHDNDKSLNGKGSTATWRIDIDNPNNDYYSQFRIFQTGLNDNNHRYLACSGIELYGQAFGGIVSQRWYCEINKSDKQLNINNC